MWNVARPISLTKLVCQTVKKISTIGLAVLLYNTGCNEQTDGQAAITQHRTGTTTKSIKKTT